MGQVRQYGDELALVTVTQTDEPPDRVLGSVAAATRRQVRVLHVDTGGAPRTSTGEVLRIGEDVGWSVAVNRAIATLDGAVGLVAVADPEIEWGPGSLDVLLDAADRHPRAGLLAPRVRDRSGAALTSAGALPSARAVARRRIPVGSADGPVGWVAGACLLVRRSAWDSVDGLDPRYRGGGGVPDLADVDLGDRLGRAGWLVVGVPAAVVTLHPGDREGVVEAYGHTRRRYLHDRFPAPVRAIAALISDR